MKEYAAHRCYHQRADEKPDYELLLGTRHGVGLFGWKVELLKMFNSLAYH